MTNLTRQRPPGDESALASRPEPAGEASAREPHICPASEGSAPWRTTIMRGGFAMAAATMVMRVASFAAQLVLGRLLLPEDFGTYAIALSFVAVAASLRSVLRPYLIGLIAENGDWAGFYRLTMWSVGGLTLAAMAVTPYLSSSFGEGRLTLLLLLMFASVPFQVYPVFGLARLNHGLAFQRMARVMAVGIIWRQVATVVAALLGFGVLSFAVGIFAGVGYEMARVRAIAGRAPGLVGAVDWRRLTVGSRSLLWLPMGIVALTVWVNGDYASAAVFESTAVVGLYYFAYQLTAAFTQPFTMAAASVLVPSFGRTDEIDRLQRNWLETLETVALAAGLPFGLLAVVAAPALHHIWAGRWDASAVAVIVLSVVMPVKLVHSVSLSVLQARRRWKDYSVFVACSAVVTAASALLGGYLGGIKLLVASVAVAQVLMALAVSSWLGVSEFGVKSRRSMLRILCPWGTWSFALLLSHVVSPMLDIGAGATCLRLVVFVLASTPLILTAYGSQIGELGNSLRARSPRRALKSEV